MAKEPARVLVTGAAGQIGYALVPMIARGVMLGPDQPVILHMLDIPPAAEALNGVKMELVDAAFPLLKGVIATTDPVEACTGVNVAVMVGGFPRKEGMERKDVMSKNVSIYKSQASALEKHAAANCKVLVVANPANTNALILKEFAPSIPEKNITCLTRLDHNRALGQISERLNVQVSDVKNVIIWGNHSSTQYPDVNHATVKTPAGEKPVRELGTWVSMGVYSDGSYNVPAGLIYSFPVICKNGEWSIVQGLSIDEFSRKKLDLTAQELSEEKALAYSCLRSRIAANKADLGRFPEGLQSEYIVGSLQDLVPPSHSRAAPRHASACSVRPLEIEPPNLRPSLPSTKREGRHPPKRQCFHRSATIGGFRSSKIQLSGRFLG
ncbi:malate dehydrogenase [Striga asiatica]|uniref:Malate dehydrogenase n=1 Tax=Striga asiatica TaxID=4170 RepID=A0A5A7RG34_STRAF|nr:malate dehydrogenase [Striga asiatica]